jgi:phage terminase Nu1 subunit (DNA packaging protein)
MVAKAAAGTGLTKAELDSIPRLRERLRDRLARADAEDEAEAAEAPRAAAEAPVGGVVNTYREVGDHFGRGERAVQNWKADGMPVRPGGGYDLAEIAAWLREKHPKALGGGSQREKREYFEARYRELKCELLELQVKIERGDLLDRGVEEANTMEIVRNFRDELLSIAPSVAPQLVGLDALTIKSVLDARLRDSLGNLATTLGAEAEEVCEAGALPGGMQDG